MMISILSGSVLRLKLKPWFIGQHNIDHDERMLCWIGMQPSPNPPLRQPGMQSAMGRICSKASNISTVHAATLTCSTKRFLQSRYCCLHPDMARFLRSLPFLLFLLAPASAATTVSFYRENSCASDSPRAGDDFTSSNLVGGSGICYKPPADTIALRVDEIEDGCSSK